MTRPSVLLVGDDPTLSQTRIDWLRNKGHVVTVTSRDAEDALRSRLYDLVVLCHTISEETVRRLIDQMTALDPRPIILLINGSEEPRQLGAETYDVRLTSPG
jgi:DNA-binding response OmpR family regulator